MKRMKAIAGIIIIFTLGIMTGVLGTSMVIKHRMHEFHEKGPPPIKPMFMKKIGRHLDLTPVQRAAMVKELDALQTTLRELRQDFHPPMQAAFDESFERMKTHLTEPQKRKLEMLKKDLPWRLPGGGRFHKHGGSTDRQGAMQRKHAEKKVGQDSGY